MASFEIPDGPTTVKLTGAPPATPGGPSGPRAGTAQFTVNNISESTMNGQFSIGVQGDSKPEWFTIDGDAERKLVASKSETVNVRIAIPATVAAGTYPFRLRVAAVNDPDNDFIDGPTTQAEVAQAAEPEKKKGIPWWVWLIGALVLLGIIGGIVWAVGGHKKVPEDAATPASTVAALVVPNLSDKNISDLPALAAGFDLVKEAGAVGGKAPGSILTQNPGPGGAPVAPGALLKVTYDPGVEVPSLAGQTTDQAIRNLRPNLFVENSVASCASDGVAGQIVSQTPGAGTRVASRTGVTVNVRVVIAPNVRVRFCGRELPTDWQMQVKPVLMQEQLNTPMMRRVN
jgi:hypothetical protein